MIAISESDDARSVVMNELSSSEPVSTYPGALCGVLLEMGEIARIISPLGSE